MRTTIDFPLGSLAATGLTKRPVAVSWAYQTLGMNVSIGTSNYVSYTAFRMDGSAKAAPAWIAELDKGTAATIASANIHS